jgi:hypothetical protein
MNNKIIAVVSMILALIFTSALILIYSNIDKFSRGAQNEVSTINSNAVYSEFEAYNDTTVSGDTVISTINKFRETRDGVKLSYLVIRDSTIGKYGLSNIIKGTNSAKVLYKFNGDAISGYIVNDITKESSATYVLYDNDSSLEIYPNDKYKSTVACRSGYPIGIIFVKC